MCTARDVLEQLVRIPAASRVRTGYTKPDNGGYMVGCSVRADDKVLLVRAVDELGAWMLASNCHPMLHVMAELALYDWTLVIHSPGLSKPLIAPFAGTTAAHYWRQARQRAGICDGSEKP